MAFWWRRAREQRGTVLDLLRQGDGSTDRAVADGSYRTNPTTYAAIGRITSAARTVPWLPQEISPSGEARDLPAQHPVARLLDEPNPWDPWEGIVEAVLGSLIMRGNAYLLLNGPGDHSLPANRSQAPREVLWWPSNSVEVLQSQGSLDIEGYRVSSGGRQEIWHPDHVVHVRTWHPDEPFQGLSAVRASAKAIRAQNLGRDWNNRLLQNTARPPGTLAAPGALTDIQYKRLRTLLDEEYGGAMQAGKVMLLEAGMKFESTGMTPGEMEWIQGLRDARREIAATMGVAPELLGDPEVKTYANAEQARAGLYDDTVVPMLRHFRHAFRKKLRAWWPGVDFYLDLDAVPAMQERRRHQQKALAELVGAGILTRNEARQVLGWNEAEGGDQLLVPMNLVPLSVANDATELDVVDEDA